MTRLRKHSHVLANYNSFPKQFRRNILKNPTIDFVKCIAKISVNIINRNVQLTKRQIESLEVKAEFIHKLASTKVKYSVKKKLFKKVLVIKLINDLIRFSLPTLKEEDIIDNV
jgi:hypothetical protein